MVLIVRVQSGSPAPHEATILMVPERPASGVVSFSHTCTGVERLGRLRVPGLVIVGLVARAVAGARASVTATRAVVAMPIRRWRDFMLEL
jgi:hypothetical protein